MHAISCALFLAVRGWLAKSTSPAVNPMVAELECPISPHLYVKTANDLMWSVVIIPWKVFVCGAGEQTLSMALQHVQFTLLLLITYNM